MTRILLKIIPPYDFFCGCTMKKHGESVKHVGHKINGVEKRKIFKLRYDVGQRRKPKSKLVKKHKMLES